MVILGTNSGRGALQSHYFRWYVSAVFWRRGPLREKKCPEAKLLRIGVGSSSLTRARAQDPGKRSVDGGPIRWLGLLRSNDPRIARQMLTLDPYEPVSNQPATHRDMSICVADPDMELLGDHIRDVLGERGDWVENVELIQASDYASVPEMARKRLGMSPGQQNLLIRVSRIARACSPSRSTPNTGRSTRSPSGACGQRWGRHRPALPETRRPRVSGAPAPTSPLPRA